MERNNSHSQDGYLLDVSSRADYSLDGYSPDVHSATAYLPEAGP